MREDRRTRVSLAAPQPAVGNVGGRAGGLSVVGPFTETAGGGGGGRQQCQELKGKMPDLTRKRSFRTAGNTFLLIHTCTFWPHLGKLCFRQEV